MLPSLVAMVIVYAICHRIGESPIGRVLKGIREDPIATQALGKNVFGYKVAVFGITSALAAFAGGDARRVAAAGDAGRVRLRVLADRSSRS